MSDIDVPRAARTPYIALAKGISTALSQRNPREVVQLAWLLIFRPDCPLELQVRAVLVHSAASLALGVNPDIVEHNIKAMIHRLAGGAELARLALRGRMAPWKLEALKQLRAALEMIRTRREEAYLGARPCPGFGLDSVVDGFRELGLDQSPIASCDGHVEPVVACQQVED